MNSFISFMAASIFFAGGIVSLRLSKRAFYSYFSPTGLFSAVWLFSLGLLYLPLLDYLALRPTTLLAFFMNILAFLFGSANVRWIFRGWDMRKPLWSPFSLVRHGLTFRATILLMTDVMIDLVAGDKVMGRDLYTNEPLIFEGYETIVLDMGNLPADDLYFQLKGKVKELYRAGDCVAPRGIDMAVLEGRRVGEAL